MRFQRKKDSQNSSISKDRMAQRVAKFLIWTQLGFAKMMTQLTKGFALARMKTGVVIFGIVGISISIYLVINSLSGNKKHFPVFQLDHVSIPTHFNQNDDSNLSKTLGLDSITRAKLTFFENYLDSVKTISNVMYDSMMSTRPGLMDSLTFVQKIYEIK